MEGRAIIYCDGAFGTTNGKTAHGLIRRSERYQVLSVVDARLAGQDAGEALDNRRNGIPIIRDLASAVKAAAETGREATHLVVGIAPDGGRLGEKARQDVLTGIRMGLNVDSGLHDFLTKDPEMVRAAAEAGVALRDIRKTPDRDSLHFFTGKIEEVKALKIAILGTDSAVGKRTTAWFLVDAFRRLGMKTELVGTGQTAWMQGARYSLIMDSLINDFVSGEIEHAVWSAWKDGGAEVIILEGQGSLMNPAYPGGFELLAAGRPDMVVMQHAPARTEYDGFPGYAMHPLPVQIQAVELLSSRPVVAVTVNHEDLSPEQIPAACEAVTRECGLPAWDVLIQGADELAARILALR